MKLIPDGGRVLVAPDIHPRIDHHIGERAMLPMDVQQLCYAKAQEQDLPPPHVAAIVDVESGGVVYGPSGDHLPMILFEPHLLYRRLSGKARDEAVALKLASKAWNKKLYPKSQKGRWQQIAEAIALLKRYRLPPQLAPESASFGVGQVLGSHWKSLGFASFDEFYKTMVSGAAGQVDVMLKYIEVNGLEDELRDGRWPAFFRGYNGPDWERNGYGTKIAAALALYGGTNAVPDGMLRMGAKGARVRELQALLLRAGYQVKVDGDFGPSTKTALKSFQVARGIAADGVYGPQTESELAEFRQGANDKPGSQKPTEVKEMVEAAAGGIGGTVAIDAAKQAVEAAKEDIVNAGVSLPIVDYLIAGLGFAAAALAVAAVLYAGYGWLKSHRTVEV